MPEAVINKRFILKSWLMSKILVAENTGVVYWVVDYSGLSSDSDRRVWSGYSDSHQGSAFIPQVTPLYRALALAGARFSPREKKRAPSLGCRLRFPNFTLIGSTGVICLPPNQSPVRWLCGCDRSNPVMWPPWDRKCLTRIPWQREV